MSDDKVVKLGGRKKKKKYLPFLYAAFALIIVGIFMYQVYKINYSPVKTEIALEKLCQIRYLLRHLWCATKHL